MLSRRILDVCFSKPTWFFVCIQRSTQCFNIGNYMACKCKELFRGVAFVILFMTDNAVCSCVTFKTELFCILSFVIYCFQITSLSVFYAQSNKTIQTYAQ